MKTFLLAAVATVLLAGCAAAPALAPTQLLDARSIEAEAKKKSLYNEMLKAFQQQLDAGDVFGYKDATYELRSFALDGPARGDYQGFKAQIDVTRGGKTEAKAYVGSYNTKTHSMGKG